MWIQEMLLIRVASNNTMHLVLLVLVLVAIVLLIAGAIIALLTFRNLRQERMQEQLESESP